MTTTIRSQNEQAASYIAEENSEWAFVGGVILAVLLVTSLPYIYAYFSAPPDKQFMGVMVNVPDHLQYFSWMRELSHSPLSANKLTPEPNSPVFFNLLWWSMGRLNNILGVGYAGMFQILRVLSTALFLWLAYHICARFLESRAMRRTALLLIVFAAGFGWILVLAKFVLGLNELPLPLLVFVSEPNTFFNILAFPHFIAAALYIVVFDIVLQGQTKNQLRYAVAAGFIALFLGWQHAYDLVLVYGILGFYGVLITLRDRRWPVFLIKSGLIVGIISCWPALYSVLLTSLDPLWKDVLAQFDNAGVFTPNPVGLIVLLGPTFLLAIFTVIKENPFRLKGVANNTLFLKSWFLANFLLIYIPTDYQIHMLNGWQVPIAILATQGFFYYVAPFAQKMAKKWHRTWSIQTIQVSLVIVLLIIVIPTNLYLWLWRFVDLNRHDYPYYLHTDEIVAMEWLEANARPEDVVLSSLTIGQYIPAHSGTHAFLAHWAQTVDFYTKERLADEFYTSTDEARQREILKMYSVDYVFYGPAEEKMGSSRLDDFSALQLVYTTPQVKIYQVWSQ